MKSSQSLIVLTAALLGSIFLGIIAQTLSSQRIISENTAAAAGCLCAAFAAAVYCIVLVTYRRERTAAIVESDHFPPETQTDENERQRTLSRAFLFAGLFCVIAGAVLSGTSRMPIAESVFSVIGSVLICLGAVGWIRMRKSGRAPMDERTKKMAVYGFMYSWYVTFVVIAEMFWLESTFGLSALWGFSPVLYTGLALLVMAASARLFQYFLYKKPDIDIR